MKPIIRLEMKEDQRRVEEIHRKAFWNLNVPGCDEHYLAHILREHQDFIKELNYVVEVDGKVVANVMYSKSILKDEKGETKEIVTFGPIGVDPEYQRRGISKFLLEDTFEKVRNMGYGAIIIFGNPDNYVSRGFKNCKKYNVCLENDIFPTSMLVKELQPDFFDGRKYYFYESDAFEIDEKLATEYDKNFEYMEKRYQPSQEEFYIHSHSVMI